MNEENRRSFVKKSLATSMTFTFAGLIRAHGEEGGSTTVATTEETTVFNPDDTTIAPTETTDSGGTTVWDPDGTTFASTIIEETTWNPNGTTAPTEETTVNSTAEATTAVPLWWTIYEANAAIVITVTKSTPLQSPQEVAREALELLSKQTNNIVWIDEYRQQGGTDVNPPRIEVHDPGTGSSTKELSDSWEITFPINFKIKVTVRE